MATPKRKISHSRSRKVHAGAPKASISLRSCQRCGAMGRPHTVCENCGHYAGREIIEKDEF